LTSPDSLQTSAPRPRSTAKLALQVLGFLIGIALLAWCVHTAFKDPEGFKRLGQASLRQIAELVGLTIVVVLCSGAVFRETLVPIRKLPMLEVQATNFIACLLVLVPFKLSVLFRVLVHNRRDKVPLLTIGAWFAAVGAVILCVLGPTLLAGIWRRGHADTLWFVSTGGGMFVLLTTLLLIARFFATERGWSWLKGHYGRIPLPARLRAGSTAATALLEKGHEGVRMLASPRVVYGCAILRLMDFAAQAGRIAVAAAIVGQDISWEHALLAGTIFFLITAAAPSGALGAREGGTAWLISAVLPGLDRDRFMLVVLAVSATEAAVLLVGSVISIAYLRPDRLLRRGHKPQT
jgi:hypothetical protein